MFELRKFVKIGCLGLMMMALLAGPAWAQDASVKTACPSPANFTLPEAAEVVSFSCDVKDYQKKFPSIHYAVAIKNVSNDPKRFRINIFLSNGKAVGGLLPVKGDPPVVGPGDVVKGEYPVKGLVDHPESLDILVKVLAD